MRVRLELNRVINLTLAFALYKSRLSSVNKH